MNINETQRNILLWSCLWFGGNLHEIPPPPCFQTIARETADGLETQWSLTCPCPWSGQNKHVKHILHCCFSPEFAAVWWDEKCVFTMMYVDGELVELKPMCSAWTWIFTEGGALMRTLQLWLVWEVVGFSKMLLGKNSWTSQSAEWRDLMVN